MEQFEPLLAVIFYAACLLLALAGMGLGKAINHITDKLSARRRAWLRRMPDRIAQLNRGRLI